MALYAISKCTFVGFLARDGKELSGLFAQTVFHLIHRLAQLPRRFKIAGSRGIFNRGIERTLRRGAAKRHRVVHVVELRSLGIGRHHADTDLDQTLLHAQG